MGSEGGLWTTLQKNMKGHWEPQRVENPAGPGTPDVYYTMLTGTMGWVELKHVDKWPVRASTALNINHFTPQQRAWLRRHGKAGCQCHVLLQVDTDYFLLDWEEAQNIGGPYWSENYSERPWIKEDYFSLSCKWSRCIDYPTFVMLIE